MDRPVFLIDHGGVKLYPDAPSTSEGSREYEHGVGQIQHQAIWSQR
jgi:23S rRNA A2030 N6-methylase RlmJ